MAQVRKFQVFVVNTQGLPHSVTVITAKMTGLWPKVIGVYTRAIGRLKG